MSTIECSSLTQFVAQAAQEILSRGHVTSPRGHETRELAGMQFVLTNPRNRLLQLPSRPMNAAFAVAELVWILGGSDHDWIFAYNSQLRRFTDGGVLRGAYGPRLRRWDGTTDQIQLAIQTLRSDRHSRRAVLQIFNPTLDYNGHADVPCTIAHRVHVRDDKLNFFTTMRSQDLWLGAPYDYFVNTSIMELMAGWLDCKLGLYHSSVDSLHLYATQWESAARAAAGPQPEALAMQPLEKVEFSDLNDLLSAVLRGESLGALQQWTEFAAVLRSHRLRAEGDPEAARDVLPTDSVIGDAQRRWYDYLDGGSYANTLPVGIGNEGGMTA